MPPRGVMAPGIRNPNLPTFSSPGLRFGGINRRSDGRLVYLNLRRGALQGVIAAQLKQYQVSAQTIAKAGTRINERAVKYLSQQANRELRRRIRARGRQQSRNPDLERLTADHNLNSSWNNQGFHFFDPKAVRLSRAFPYYRAIEFGSRHMVGKYVPLTFLSNGAYVPPPSVRTRYIATTFNRDRQLPRAQRRTTYTARSVERAAAQTGDALRDYVTYGGRSRAGNQGSRYTVRIKRPIRPYYYITTAVERFEASGVYGQIVSSEVRRLAPLLARSLEIRNRRAGGGAIP